MPGPEFVTLTGIGSESPPDQVASFAERYAGRFEWGVLALIDGADPGVPDKGVAIDALPSFAARFPGPKSLHLVFSRAPSCLPGPVTDALPSFGRVQLNLPVPEAIATARLVRGAGYGGPIIIPYQADALPADTCYEWLFDRSGGRGLSPGRWPSFETDRLCGFAGGLGPRTVAGAIAQIRASHYWLDMESSLRAHGRFSLERCDSVLRRVFGDGRSNGRSPT